jgi:CRP-like cAMP-binding protein
MRDMTAIDEEVDTDLLRQVPLLAGLEDDLLASLIPICSSIMVAEGEQIAAQGEQCEYAFMILSGQVALVNVAPNGDTAVVEVIHPGEQFFLSTVLSGLSLLVSAQAVAPARLLRLEAAGIMALLPSQPALTSALLRAGAMDFRSMVRQVCDLKLRTTAQRLCCYLLSLSTNEDANSVALRLPFDKRLLAARLGCRQENLSRAFAALRSVGVETHGSRVILHDVARLRDYAVPDAPAEAGLA